MSNILIKGTLANRSDTAANWQAANPVLLQGEIAHCIDQNYLKIGDGTRTWKQLPAFVPCQIEDSLIGGSEKVLSAEQGKILNGRLQTAETKLNTIETGANKTRLANNLTTSQAGQALDAHQGAALNTRLQTAEEKLQGVEAGANKTVLANNLATSTTGKALDAVQGRAIDTRLKAAEDKLQGIETGANKTVMAQTFGGSTEQAASQALLTDSLQYIRANMGVYTVWVGTKAEYDALGSKSDSTLYFVKEA